MRPVRRRLAPKHHSEHYLSHMAVNPVERHSVYGWQSDMDAYRVEMHIVLACLVIVYAETCEEFQLINLDVTSRGFSCYY